MAVDESGIFDPFTMTVAMIVGPYFGDGSYAVIDGNIERARAYAVALANRRIGFFCAHTHTGHFEILAEAPEGFYLGLDLRFLSLADCAIFTPGWEQSSGSVREHRRAQEWGIRCFYPTLVDNLDEVVAWSQGRTANGILPILGLLIEAERWVKGLRERFNLRGWNHTDECMLDRIGYAAAFRPPDNERVLQLLRKLLVDTSSWLTDFLAFANAFEDDPTQRQSDGKLDVALHYAHVQIRHLLAAA